MNEHEFRRHLKRISKDLDLIFDPVSHLWGVYQVRSTRILTAPGTVRPWLLFNITDTDGRSHRGPDQRDLQRAASFVYSSRPYWDQKDGGDKIIDKLESNEKARRQKRTERTNDTIKQAAKDLAFHVNQVKTRGRDRRDVGTAGVV